MEGDLYKCAQNHVHLHVKRRTCTYVHSNMFGLHVNNLILFTVSRTILDRGIAAIHVHCNMLTVHMYKTITERELVALHINYNCVYNKLYMCTQYVQRTQ